MHVRKPHGTNGVVHTVILYT